MKLSFITLLNTEQIQFYTYDVPGVIVTELFESLDLEPNKDYVISFSRFVDFDNKYHGLAVEYFLSGMMNNINRIVIGETNDTYQVKYEFKDPNLVLQKFDLDQLLFLSSMFHRLNLRKYLAPCVGLLMNRHAMKFDEIKNLVKSDTYSINIFHK